MFQFPGWWEETSYLGILAEGYQNIELSRCIFQISLKYIKLVIPKNALFTGFMQFYFYCKITWPPPAKLPHPQQYNLPSNKIKISDALTPPSKDFSQIFNHPLPTSQAGGRGKCMPWFPNRGFAWFFAISKGLRASSQVVVFLECFYNFVFSNWPNFINRLSFLPKLLRMYFLFYAWTFDDVMKLKYLKFQNLIFSGTKRAFEVK